MKEITYEQPSLEDAVENTKRVDKDFIKPR